MGAKEPLKKVWYPEIDILKATAILLIVFSHLDDFVSDFDLIGLIDGYTAQIGLSIFFFVSGFLLSQHDSGINSKKSIIKFYKKKIIRLFPLYWAALISLIVIIGLLYINPGHVSQDFFNLNNLLLHIFGLQGIFPYDGVDPVWFVGVIVLFYLLFPLFAHFSRTCLELITLSLLTLILFAILHYSVGIIHINSILYFPMFISGILINKKIYSTGEIYNVNLLNRILIFSIILGGIALLFMLLNKIYHLGLQSISSLLMIFLLIIICISSLIFTRMFVKLHGNLMIIFSTVAFGTYAIYLFHYQFLSIFSLIVDGFVHDVTFEEIIILTIGTAGAIISGIIIQMIEQRVSLK